MFFYWTELERQRGGGRVRAVTSNLECHQFDSPLEFPFSLLPRSKVVPVGFTGEIIHRQNVVGVNVSESASVSLRRAWHRPQTWLAGSCLEWINRLISADSEKIKIVVRLTLTVDDVCDPDEAGTFQSSCSLLNKAHSSKLIHLRSKHCWTWMNV